MKMHLQGKYLLVTYRDLPDTHFICEYGSDLRIRVSRVPKEEMSMIQPDFLARSSSNLVLVFENISNRIIEEQDELMRAVHWYKTRLGLKSMNLLYL